MGEVIALYERIFRSVRRIDMSGSGLFCKLLGYTVAEMYDYDTINAMLLEAQLEEGLTKAQALARLRENNFGY